MKRRKVLKALAILSGGMLVTSSAIFSACNFSQVRSRVSEEDLNLLNEIGETIIPKTTSCGGARDANIGVYMRNMVEDCFNQERRSIFLKGLTDLENASKNEFENAFLHLNKVQKKQLFLKLQAESANFKHENSISKISRATEHYFEIFMDLTVNGYFTSEIGATQARRYQPIPGNYNGCINYKVGDKAWATR